MKYRLLLHHVWATHPQCWHIKDILSTRGGIRPTPPLANLVLHLRSKPLWSSSLEHCFYFSFIKSLRQEGQWESHKGHFASLSLFLPAHTVGCICNQRLTLLAILSPNAVIKGNVKQNHTFLFPSSLKFWCLSEHNFVKCVQPVFKSDLFRFHFRNQMWVT